MRRFLKETVSIIGETRVPNGTGGVKVVKGAVIDTVKAMLDTPTSDEVFQTNQLQAVTFDRYMYVAYKDKVKIPRDTTLHHTERDGTKTEYTVVGKPTDEGGRNRFVRVLLKEVKVV